jgi:hypothetical protein
MSCDGITLPLNVVTEKLPKKKAKWIVAWPVANRSPANGESNFTINYNLN